MPLSCCVRPFQARRDLEAALQLYMEHGGDYLPVPDADDLCEAADDGMLFVLAGVNDLVLGVAGLFRMGTCKGASPDPVQVYEMAGMVLAPVLRGYRLQGVMLALRATALAREASTNTALMASVVAENAASLKSLTRGGFVRCETPGWLKVSHRSWTTKNSDVVDLVMPPVGLQENAQLLMDVSDNPVRKRTLAADKSSQINLEINIEWLRTERDVLEDYQKGLLPAWENAIPQTRLVGTSPNWISFSP